MKSCFQGPKQGPCKANRPSMYGISNTDIGSRLSTMKFSWKTFLRKSTIILMDIYDMIAALIGCRKVIDWYLKSRSFVLRLSSRAGSQSQFLLCSVDAISLLHLKYCRA